MTKNANWISRTHCPWLADRCYRVHPIWNDSYIPMHINTGNKTTERAINCKNSNNKNLLLLLNGSMLFADRVDFPQFRQLATFAERQTLLKKMQNLWRYVRCVSNVDSIVWMAAELPKLNRFAWRFEKITAVTISSPNRATQTFASTALVLDYDCFLFIYYLKRA